MTSLTRWLLRAFAAEWPGGLPEPGDAWGPLYLEDRDNASVVDHSYQYLWSGGSYADAGYGADSVTLEYRTPSQDFDLSTGNVLGVALTDYPQNPAGLGGQEYRAEPVLSVRLEAAPSRKHGHVADAEDFEALALQAIEVVQGIDNGTLKAAPVADFHVAEPENQNPDMSGWKDRYQWQFDVGVTGYRTL